jgi:hypothetical protein
MQRMFLALSALAVVALPGVAMGAPALAAGGTVEGDWKCVGPPAAPDSGPVVCVSWIGVRDDFHGYARGSGYFGHIDLYGPGMGLKQTPDMNNPTRDAHGIGEGWLCAHGWRPAVSGYEDMGWPCVYVSWIQF